MATRNINNYINELLNEDKYDRLVNATPEQKERLRELDRKREARESDPNTGKYSRTLRTGGLDAAITELEDDGRQDTVGKIKTGVSNKTRRPVSADQSPTRTTPLTPERQKKDDALVADAQKDFDRYDRIEAGVRAQTDANTQMAQDIGRRVDASLAGSKDFAKELAAYKEQDKARQARIAGLKSGQGTNQEREARIADSQRATMSDNAKSIASGILKGFGAGRSTGKAEMEPTQGVGRYEPRESFPSARKLVKNKGLGRAAQADKTGDAYMAQVMKTGAGKTLKGGKVERGIIPTAIGNVGAVNPFTRPDSGIRNTLGVYDPNRKYEPPRTADYRFDRDDPIGGYGPDIPRRANLRTDLFNRAGGPNIMPRQGPARAGGPNIMPDMKRKRMGY